MTEIFVNTETLESTAEIFGAYDKNLSLIEKEFGVRVRNRESADKGPQISVSGEDSGAVSMAAKTLKYLARVASSGEQIGEQRVIYAINAVKEGQEQALAEFDRDCICITARGKPIKAKTLGQKQYVEKIKKNTLTLGIGPAGTGKTFLAVAVAVQCLRKKEIERIVLTRPAVEAGEKLGYLPGDLQNKIDPYLRPLYDALYETMGAEAYARALERGVIEIAPLAYMRGRTLDSCFIILDEAQNTTTEQMKMFLTRLGEGSKAVVTGDVTQTDLPFGKKSGLVQAERILADIEDIAIHRFTERDVVRHKLVQRIIKAYEKYESAHRGEAVQGRYRREEKKQNG